VSSVADLYALQEVDIALDAARTALTDVESRLGESEELAEARARLAERQEAARAAEHAYKEAEFETDELTRKIEPLEAKLYDGSVRNPKELEDLQKDIESLRRRRLQLDDNALNAMEALEVAQAALLAAQTDLDEVGRTVGAEQVELAERKDQLDEELAELESLRLERAPAIDNSLMSLYTRLAANKQKRAIAKVEGGACGGCRISLPMNLITRARSSNEIVQCSSCERILYVS
jgi:predicted  nucleic acid-binding Zn-ribbon protein